MKSIFLSVILAAAIFSSAAQNFNELFDDFAQQTQIEYSDFRQEANQQFVDILKESWVEFNALGRMEYPRKPKPKVLPIASTIQPIKNDSLLDSKAPIGNNIIIKTDTINDNKHALIANDTITLGNVYSFSFYNNPLSISIPNALIDYKMKGNKELDVAGYWEFLSSDKSRDAVENVIVQINKYITQMNLNDWGVYLLIATLSKNIFVAENLNEKEVFITFLLNQIELDARLGLADGGLVTMVAIKEQVYARVYCEYNGRKYYFSPEIEHISTLLSYRRNFPRQLYPISVNIVAPLNLSGNKDCIVYVEKEATVLHSDISLPINVNLLNFYRDFPQVDIDIYLKAFVDENFSTALLSAIAPCLHNKSKKEQVELLMRFMHYDFRYQTDDEQFGYEKPFFTVENFIYPYNDCEDRSILLAYLIRNLVCLDAVLVEYSDHVAVAICFEDDSIEKHFEYKGDKYTICDPTYIGASIGDIMEGYKKADFNIITF